MRGKVFILICCFLLILFYRLHRGAVWHPRSFAQSSLFVFGKAVYQTCLIGSFELIPCSLPKHDVLRSYDGFEIACTSQAWGIQRRLLNLKHNACNHGCPSSGREELVFAGIYTHHAPRCI